MPGVYIYNYNYLFQVSWRLNGERLPSSASGAPRHRIETHDTLSVLTVRDLDDVDLGNYSCQATNKVGQATDYIEVTGE